MTIVFFYRPTLLILHNVQHTHSIIRVKLFSNRSLLGWHVELYLGYIVIETALAMLYSVILSRVNAINGGTLTFPYSKKFFSTAQK